MSTIGAKPREPDRLAIYIDGSNLYHNLKDRFNRTDLDFGKFITILTADRRLVRAYYYNARVDQMKEPERYQHQQRFFDRLRDIPYLEVRLRKLIYRKWPNEAPYEKGVDVHLAIDMVVHSFRGNFDTALWVSGDNDLADALQAVKDEGHHAEVALFGSARSSYTLREVADRVIPLEKVVDECWLRE